MKQEQFDKLDKKVYIRYSIDDECFEECIEARKLLCTARFDFYGILLYIDCRVKGIQDMSFARKVYLERTRAMTGDSFCENSNPDKNSFEAYVNSLDNLINDCLNNRFDPLRTFIPVDRDYIPMDGAHRVCCAAYFNKKVNILRFPEYVYQFKGYKYLQHELMPSYYSDILALEAINWHDDLYTFFLWPRGHVDLAKLDVAKGMINAKTDILYEVEYKLSYKALRNFMLQIYGHMDWLGNIDNNFSNLSMKVDEVWADNGLVHIIITRAPSCSFVTNLKAEIRAMYGIGLSSCHTTDNINETRLAINALLNKKSRYFLEMAEPTKYKSSYKLFERFRSIIELHKLPSSNFILDSSIVLSIFGAREANDLDFYSLPGTDLKAFQNETDIEEHDDTQKVFYKYPITDYINCFNNYFVFNGIKFMSLENLLQFKQARYSRNRNSKDVNDIELIKVLCQGLDRWQKWKQNFIYYIKRKWRKAYDYVYALIFWRRREILEKVGLYKPLKWIKTHIFHK